MEFALVVDNTSMELELVVVHNTSTELELVVVDDASVEVESLGKVRRLIRFHWVDHRNLTHC